MSAVPRRAILHIGTEKTGSTSIQASLSANRHALATRGFAYARSTGERNHIRLALYALGEEGGSQGLQVREARARPGEDAIATWLPDALGQEMAALPASIHTVVFSNEHCHSRVRSVDGVQRLKALLDRSFESYRIVVYLRRQDELAVSRYSTLIKTGSARSGILPPTTRATGGYFDYAALLDRWAAVFGEAALVPRLFIRRELVDGDVVTDFLGACGLPGFVLPAGAATENVSLSAVGLEFLRRVNMVLLRETGGARPRRLLRLAGRFGASAALLPSRAEAEAFHARFAAGNEAVRQRFFPDRAQLFPQDFSRYPTTASPPPLADVLALAQRVLAQLDKTPEARKRNQADWYAEVQAVQSVVAGLQAEC